MKRLHQIVLIVAVALSLLIIRQATSQEKDISDDTSGKLAAHWILLQEQLSQDQLGRASDEFSQLLMIRDAAGIEALPGYAHELIQGAKAADLNGDRDKARVLFRWALRLAPASPEILWQALPVYKKHGLGTLFDQLGSISVAILSSPSRMLLIVQKSIYPVLNALSWALYIAFLAILAAHIMTIFRVLGAHVRPSLRGILLPLLFLLLFALPVFFGFLWCLTCWSVAIYVLIPERRRLSLATGIVLLAWGVLVPLCENLKSWLQSDAIDRVLLFSEQPLREQELQELRTQLSLWNEDVVVQFKFAQILRRAGQLQDAEKVLTALERAQGVQDWIEAERAVQHSLRGNFVAAEKSSRKALAMGNNSAELLFNLSKVVFELDNTKESRELFGKALKKSRHKVEVLRKREELLGIHDSRSFADVELPFSTYMAAALIPNHQSFALAEARAAQLMTGCGPRAIAMIGILIILMHLSGHKSSRRIHPKGLFDGYQGVMLTSSVLHLIPGASFFTERKFISGFLILFTMVVAALPLVRGLYQTQILAAYQWFFPYHVCFWLCAYFLIALHSIQQARE